MRKAKSLAALIIVTVLIGFFTFVVFNGLSIGIYNFRPVDAIQQGLDITGGVYTVYQAKDTSVADFEQKMNGTLAVFRTRLDGKGFTEATITREGTDKIRVEIPINKTSPMQDPNEISKFIGTPAKLQFKDPNGTVVMEGADIQSAKMVTDQAGTPQVDFTLSDAGAKKFAEATAKFIGQKISIVLDDNAISEPVVQSIIAGGNGQITNPNFTKTSANELAMQIESGALPLDLNEIESQSESATLGANALQASIIAGLWGMVVLFIFMVLMYRIPGLMACIALVLYLDLMVMMLGSVPGVQLTLPGIAGIILGIGMAVDANVIIYERFNEEVRAGKTLRVAQKLGFSKAFITILDANITTIICAIVLSVFGTGTIKSFAYTLIISILVSMFTALIVSRSLLRWSIDQNVKNQGAFVRKWFVFKGGAIE
ncbi:MAG: protein translocase subunit SecD [Eubacteriales bacterium]